MIEHKTCIFLPCDCIYCKYADKSEHEYPCCLCVRLNALRSDRFETE